MDDVRTHVLVIFALFLRQGYHIIHYFSSFVTTSRRTRVTERLLRDTYFWLCQPACGYYLQAFTRANAPPLCYVQPITPTTVL